MQFRAVLSTVILSIFGFSILAVSLVSANKGITTGYSRGLVDNETEIYFNDELKPDHTLYPIQAGIDKLGIALSVSDKDRFTLIYNNAKKRLRYSRELVEKERYGLSASVMSKSFSYSLILIDNNDFFYSIDVSDQLKVLSLLEQQLSLAKEINNTSNEMNKSLSQLTDSVKVKYEEIMSQK
jgi:hypothetical protein